MDENATDSAYARRRLGRGAKRRTLISTLDDQLVSTFLSGVLSEQLSSAAFDYEYKLISEWKEACAYYISHGPKTEWKYEKHRFHQLSIEGITKTGVSQFLDHMFTVEKSILKAKFAE